MIGEVKRIVKKLPGISHLDRYFRYRYTGSYCPEPYPRGHYYSPLPDIGEVESRADVLFREEDDLAPSIDLKAENQCRLLLELAHYYNEFCWPARPSRDFRFYQDQEFFGQGDAIILYSLLRHFKPKKVIEGGSGFTSALMLDVDDKFTKNQTRFTFIEPFPERLLSLLRDDDLERCQIIKKNLQDVPLSTLRSLEANDILFIDSSHVSKIGSDVNFILFEILPALNSGVLIHFHDVLWPFEYPLEWIKDGKAWNEAYLLRAFLQYNSQFEVVLLNCFVARAFTSLIEQHMPLFLKNPGGSLWVRKL